MKHPLTMHRPQLFPFLVSIYTTALVLRPVLVSKIIEIDGVIFPGALLVFPLSFVCNDIFSEVYGFERSRSIIWAGLLAQCLATFVIVLVSILPSAAFWQHQAAFDQVLGQSPRIAVASLVGYFFGELTNSMIISKMKFSQNGMTGFRQVNRFVVSTIFGELIDSFIFVSCAFYGIYPLAKIMTLILTTWILKSVYEFAFLPLSTRLAEKVKELEQTNIIDCPEDTDYRFFTNASYRGQSIEKSKLGKEIVENI